MKKHSDKKAYILIGISMILFLLVSILSFVSIKTLQGNAKVVNFDGIVRGATQKLIKMELQEAYSDVDVENTIEKRDALRNRLDTILFALDTGKGKTEETKNIIVLNDPTHKEDIKKLLVQWNDLKKEIKNVRDKVPNAPQELFLKSEAYFVLANDTVFAAEAYSERQVNNSTTILIVVNGLFIGFILIAGVFIIRGFAARKRADALGKIAYVDSLTGLENRASCERLITHLKANPSDNNLAVLMFDMNNLKLANDFLGHQGGDKIIAKFASILNEESKGFGFIGRFGGDEFLGIFENADLNKAEEYLALVNNQVSAFNSLQVNEIEKISFASGISIGHLSRTTVDDMIYEADRNMYANKRQMKLKL
ncbi:MAG: GGDEF domain-containing protein [Bacillales bacterium]|jgi:diguanylate cyclase (GGDEF)-like protein|nr:GGDEF domain-containing protein [Bacillales bacterium]